MITPLDATDQKIISFLIKNARTPFLEIARECGVTGAAIHQRVKKLEKSGVISGSRVVVKPSALGLNVCAFVGIKVTVANDSRAIIKSLEQIPEVTECHYITGSHGLLLKVYCTDNDHLLNVLANKIQRIDGVADTETWISLEEAIGRPVWVDQK